MNKLRRQLLAGPYLVWIIGFIILPLLMILYYAFFYRGISIYKNKKIRVFNFKVTTYINGIIEDIKIEELDKTSKLIVLINGKENVFWVSSKSAQKYMSELQKATTVE